MRVVPVEEPQKYGVVVGVTEQPAPASGVVVGVLTEQPGASEGREGGRGSLEFLGRWNENIKKRAMPIKLKAERNRETMVRVAFGRLVDELMQNGASGGILAIWGQGEFSWSANPDDTSYQRHGFVGMESDQRENIRFADFEGAVHDIGDEDQIAVYRVTLPSGGLDPEKWVGRPPPLAPEDLYTGPRRDGLLSTEEISGDYRCCCFPFCCNSMTVVPHGPDMIETWSSGCYFLPPFIGPTAEAGVRPGVRPRDPGTNGFRDPQNPDPNAIMTFSADGTAKVDCGSYKKRPGSQKRAFHKVETRDLAGNWRGCQCWPFVPLWPFTSFFCTTKKALNQDQYEESGLCCWLCLPLPYLCGGTRTRVYVNGHPTNGFAKDGAADPNDVHWHRDPGCAGSECFFAKKVG